MNVKVIGKRVVRKETADFKRLRHGTVIHTIYSDPRVDGTAVKSFWIDAKVYSPKDITIGNEYHVEEVYVRSGNYVVKVERVKENA